MNKKATAAGGILATALIVILGLMIISGGWPGGEITPIPYGPGPGGLSFAIFETYGPMIVVLSMLLFGAIVGGAAISRGEKKKEDEK